jgi:glycerate kinase
MVIAGDVSLDKSVYRSFGITDAIGLKEKNMTTEYAMLNSEQLLKTASNKFVEKLIIK